jgi:hypothetical protein
MNGKYTVAHTDRRGAHCTRYFAAESEARASLFRCRSWATAYAPDGRVVGKVELPYWTRKWQRSWGL